MVYKLQLLTDKELEDLSFIYFTSPIDRASKEITGSPKIVNLPTSLKFNSISIMSKQWKKHNFQVRYALYVKDHLTGEKSGQKFGMKWNIVLMHVKKKEIRCAKKSPFLWLKILRLMNS